MTFSFSFASCGTRSSDPFCWQSAWAISGYCFSVAFIFGVTQIITRHILSKQASTQVTMRGVNSDKSYSVKRGRTRLIPEMLTLSFLFRAVWFFVKGLPGEPWACYNESVSFPNATHYGDWEYALREMFNRFATLMSFSAFTVLVIYWAGTSTIPTKYKVQTMEMSRLGDYSSGKYKKAKPKYTSVIGCCQGFYVSLNVWLYIVLIGITIVNFIPNNDLNDKCSPVVDDYNPKTNVTCWCEAGQINDTSPTSTWERATACLVNRTYLTKYFLVNTTYKWRDPTPWHVLYETQILFTNALYILLVLGLSFYGAGVMRALKGVHTDGKTLSGLTTTDKADASELQRRNIQAIAGTNQSQRHRLPVQSRRCGIQTMRCKILIMIIACSLCFVTRFVLFLWPYVVPPPNNIFTGLACEVIRPYFQYVVVELVPALILLIIMHPIANRPNRPKFSSSTDVLVPNNAEDLVVSGGRRATTHGVPLLAANDPRHRI